MRRVTAAPAAAVVVGADWVKVEIEFHKIRENGKETEMVETNFLPSRGLLQGKVKETFEWGEEEKWKIINQSI